MTKQLNRQEGAVSLFIVIFTTIIVTVITVSFTQLMIRNQEQSTTNDLSQSAYDSALAGVEDAKRVLLRLASCSPASCQQVQRAVDQQECNTIQSSGLINAGDEVTVDATLNQAYTCVKIRTDTENVETGYIAADQSYMVPLKAVGGSNAFNRVRITWFTQQDAGGDVSEAEYPQGVNFPDLPPLATWGEKSPPVARTQFIQSGSESRSAFLYPTSAITGDASKPTPVPLNSADLGNQTNSDSPVQNVTCNTTFAARGDGVCSADVILTNAGSRPTHLAIMPMYNGAHFTIELYNGSNRVNFDGVQPEVDSTGRASDLFRRVLARIDIRSGTTPAYPSAGVNVEKNFCKTFFVTDNEADYLSGGCDPSKYGDE